MFELRKSNNPGKNRHTLKWSVLQIKIIKSLQNKNISRYRLLILTVVATKIAKRILNNMM